LSLAGLISVAVGGFSCRLFERRLGWDSSGLDTDLFGYGSYEGYDGTCVPYYFSGLSGTDAAGFAVAFCATLVGSLWFLAALLARAATRPSSSARRARPCSSKTAAAVAAALAFFVSAASVVMAFLGLASGLCHSHDYVCTPGGMAYLVVFGALCWAGAGIAMCYVFQQARKEEEEEAADERIRGGAESEQAECEIPVASASEEEAENVVVAAAPPRSSSATNTNSSTTTTTTVVEIEEEDGTVSTTRTTTVTSYDKEAGTKVIERTIERQ
jgi:hypothetical protein